MERIQGFVLLSRGEWKGGWKGSGVPTGKTVGLF